jgi:hypothetical protein
MGGDLKGWRPKWGLKFSGMRYRILEAKMSGLFIRRNFLPAKSPLPNSLNKVHDHEEHFLF